MKNKTTTVRGACAQDCRGTCAFIYAVEDGRASFVGSAPIFTDTTKGVVASYLGCWASASTSKSAVDSMSSDRTSKWGNAPVCSDNLAEVKLVGDRSVGYQSAAA